MENEVKSSNLWVIVVPLGEKKENGVEATVNKLNVRIFHSWWNSSTHKDHLQIWNKII